MTRITITQTFGTLDKLIAELNKLPEFNREDILMVKTYDGWRPMFFKWVKDSFETISINMTDLLTTDENS